MNVAVPDSGQKMRRPWSLSHGVCCQLISEVKDLPKRSIWQITTGRKPNAKRLAIDSGFGFATLSSEYRSAKGASKFVRTQSFGIQYLHSNKSCHKPSHNYKNDVPKGAGLEKARSRQES